MSCLCTINTRISFGNFLSIFHHSPSKSGHMIQHDAEFFNGIDKYRLNFEFRCFLDFINGREKLEEMQKEKHILNQWKNEFQIFEYCSSIKPKLLKQVIETVAVSPNCQRGFEGSNSKIARFKGKYASRMGVPVIESRGRLGENDPAIHKLPMKKILKKWKLEGHRLAERLKSNNDSKVVSRIRRKKTINNTCKIFT